MFIFYKSFWCIFLFLLLYIFNVLLFIAYPCILQILQVVFHFYLCIHCSAFQKCLDSDKETSCLNVQSDHSLSLFLLNFCCLYTHLNFLLKIESVLVSNFFHINVMVSKQVHYIKL